MNRSAVERQALKPTTAAVLICWFVTSSTVWNLMLLIATFCRGLETAAAADIDQNATATSSSSSSLLPLDVISLIDVDRRPSAIADFEKPLSEVDLLALKVDRSLMRRLDEWLAKYGIQLPQSLLDTIDRMDLCPERATDGLRHYCTKMANGLYYDPWNPWCGYITCQDGKASRQICRPGSWMGGSLDVAASTMESMCRRRLDSQRVCSELTDHGLCRTASALMMSQQTTG